MINSISLVFIILFIGHYIADFVFQSDWMAKNKSQSLLALGTHIFIYTAVLFLFSLLTTHFFYDALAFTVINGVIHFIVDFNTSKLNSYLYHNTSNHWFFVGIGFDQLLHTVTIIITADLFLFQKIL